MWFNNLLGWLLKHIYGATPYILHKDVFVYEVKRMFPKFAHGQTMGNYIFVRKESKFSKGLIRHEYVHVLQFRKFGIFFLPCYFFASVYAFFRYGPKHYYDKNWFEVQADK